MKNRFLSFVVIVAVYVIAVIVGIFSYAYFKGIFIGDGVEGLRGFMLPLFLADVAATVVVFIFSLIFGNASVYDPYWSVQPPVILCVALVKCGNSALGLLLFAAVLFWGLRLTANWAYTFKSLEHQDWRYSMLREKTGKFYVLINFLGIHLFPTVVVYLCILPAVAAVQAHAPFRPLCVVFLLLSVTATVCQGIADVQMQIFRKKGTGGFIRTGLWKTFAPPELRMRNPYVVGHCACERFCHAGEVVPVRRSSLKHGNVLFSEHPDGRKASVTETRLRRVQKSDTYAVGVGSRFYAVVAMPEVPAGMGFCR